MSKIGIVSIHTNQRKHDRTISFSDIVVISDGMRAVLRTARKAAASTIPVLVEGETGVGKELIARAIHGSGERRAKPFVAVNCGALPDNLVESILFGHEKGAFTGAIDRHIGKFVEASGGTLFLDEVGELPSPAQVKLLRVLQENEVEPVGSRQPISIDIRLISATNRNLPADVQAGRFREDLFYRLYVFPITVPPLRERPEDIPELVRHFLARLVAREGRRCTIDAAALKLLGAQAWPGNVRQLENTLFRAVVVAETDSIGISDLSHLVDSGTRERARPTHLLDANGDIRPLHEIEDEAVRFAVEYYNGQLSEAARRLQISRSTLYRKLRHAERSLPQE